MPLPALRAALFAAALLSAACVHVDSQGHSVREEHRFKIEGQPDLRLTTFDGSVEVRSWDQPEVLVEIEKRGPSKEAIDRLEVVVNQQGDRIELEARRPMGGDTFIGIGINISPQVRYIATVPRNAAIVARSGDGAIRIERITGRIELRTDDGSIRGDELSGELSATTGDGSVVLDDVNGSVEISTSDGGVSVTGRLARARVRTGDGSVTLRAEPGSAMSGDWTLTTSDGGVVVYLPADFNADIDAHTGDGRIRSEFSLAEDETKRENRTVRGRIGKGGHTLKVRTGDGSIVLRTGV
jgi:Putative adhesin